MNLSFFPSIDIIMGPMLCGKTSEVIRRLIIYHEMEMKVLYINNAIDSRSDSAFSTHNATIGKVPFDAIKITDLFSQDVSKYDVIAIDEASFFSDLKETVLKWVEQDKKIVIVAGLNGDFKREPFGQINDLIPYCDSVTKLAPFCMFCRKKGVMRAALFSKRIVPNDCNVLIGGKDVYSPTCRECFLVKE
jgi:thymidine kinase